VAQVSYLLEQAINCNNGDQAAKIIQDALGGLPVSEAPPYPLGPDFLS
jgi:hypothetical protein